MNSRPPALPATVPLSRLFPLFLSFQTRLTRLTRLTRPHSQPPPDRLCVHSSGGTGTSRTLTYEQSVRHGRLTCFSQYRQLFDFVDWLGVHWSVESFPGRDGLVGFVALAGGRRGEPVRSRPNRRDRANLLFCNGLRLSSPPGASCKRLELLTSGTGPGAWLSRARYCTSQLA